MFISFAKANVEDDSNMFFWMFDRNVVPRSFASDEKVWNEYNEITGLIWPEEWATKVC